MAALRQAMNHSKVVGINTNSSEQANCDKRNQQAKSKSVSHMILLRSLISRTVLQRVVKKL
jgi:hypothetical protein